MLGLFVMLGVAAFGLTGVVVGIAGVPALWLPAFSAMLLGATWICLRIERRKLRDLGLRLTGSRLRELGAGFLVGAGLFAAMTFVQGLLVGGSWHLSGSVSGIAGALAFMLVSVMIEELMFRGYAFDRLRAIGGSALAVILSSLLFGAYHLVGQGYWAMGAFFQFAMPVVGGLIFSLALIRSGGMALPVGLHWGGNFAPLAVGSIWTANLTPEQMQAWRAPDLLPHLPYLTVMAVMALAVWFCRRTLVPTGAPTA